jgi:hypothetical protein
MDGDEEIDTLGDPSKPYFSEDPGYRFFNLSNVHQTFQEGHKCIMVLGQRGDIQLPTDVLYLTGQVLDYGFGQRFVLRVTNRRQIRIRMIYKVWHDKLFPKPE